MLKNNRQLVIGNRQCAIEKVSRIFLSQATLHLLSIVASHTCTALQGAV